MARQRRTVETPLDKLDSRFEGSSYSNPELRYLIAHFGEPFIVACPEDTELPEGVNEKAVRPILDRTFELELYQTNQRERLGDAELTLWCGYEALRDICERTLQWNAQVVDLKRRTRGASGTVRAAAGAPSLCVWDPSTDIPSMGGVGADAERVLTSIEKDGRRRELYVELRQTGFGALRTHAGVASMLRGSNVEHADVAASNKVLDTTPEQLDIMTGDSYGTVTCPICQKSETFEVAKPESKKMALAVITKHLTAEKVVKVESHRLLAKRLKSGRQASQRIPAGSAEVQAQTEA